MRVTDARGAFGPAHAFRVAVRPPKPDFTVTASVSGASLLNVGLNGILVTERETSREVVLYAEPWVQPMERPLVVLARREGTSAEYAAKTLLLKIEK